MSAQDAFTRATHIDLPAPDDLTSFRIHTLAVLADGPRYGLSIKRELEDYYGKEVVHSRVYQNLDALVTHDLVEKQSVDDRTNEYSLTPDGERLLEREYGFLAGRMGRDAEVIG